jgi:hypothetical protein
MMMHARMALSISAMQKRNEFLWILQFLYSHASKSKALAYFRDNAINDVNVPITKQGILHVKVTIINGRVSFRNLFLNSFGNS